MRLLQRLRNRRRRRLAILAEAALAAYRAARDERAKDAAMLRYCAAEARRLGGRRGLVVCTHWRAAAVAENLDAVGARRLARWLRRRSERLAGRDDVRFSPRLALRMARALDRGSEGDGEAADICA